MKISYNWLKEYVSGIPEPSKVAEILTASGLEVESTETWFSVKGGLSGVITGEVLTCAKHPDSDHLSITTVNIGVAEPLKIVCGASNVAAGQKVAVATIGTTLYFNDKEITIQRAKIRGEISEGMICAEDELGLGKSHEGIMVLDPSVVPGIPAKDFFNVEEDTIFEIGLTPNRSDATSHIGVARDLAAALNWMPGYEQPEKIVLKYPDISDFNDSRQGKRIDVIIEDAIACPRYSGLTFTGITVKESPAWLKNRLNAVGLRPINNIVDITNFILMELGQPLHAFDADQVKGDKVIIRKFKEPRIFTTLDEVEREITVQDLMICNTEEPMCIAGVFGGLKSGVTSATTSIFLESAYFNPKDIRKTARYHGLQTDASFRFERGADINITLFALKRAAALICGITGGEVASAIVDVYPDPKELNKVSLSFEHLDRLIGKTLERNLVKNILSSLGIAIINSSETGLELEIPSYKVDVTREADVIEEILRIYGYNNIEFSTTIRSSISSSPKPDPDKVRNSISDYLCSNGFSEIMNNSLTRSSYYEGNAVYPLENNVKILNPLSRDLDVMRQTLLYGGLETLEYNQNRKIVDCKLFESGNCYFIQPLTPTLPPNGGREESSPNPVSSIQDPASSTQPLTPTLPPPGGWEELSPNPESSIQHPASSIQHPLDKYREENHLALFLTGRSQKENWNSSGRKSDVYDLTGYVNTILRIAGISSSSIEIIPDTSGNFSQGLVYKLNDKTLVSLGTLSSALLKKFDMRQDVYCADFNWNLLFSTIDAADKPAAGLPKFPEVRRDLALLLDRTVSYAELEELAFATEKKLLREVGLFDVYEGEKIEMGKKSYALYFILQDDQKTLTDEEIDKTMKRIIKAYTEKLNALVR